ncbi:MAG: ABC transporter substrate-binding protein [Thermoleophilia bacterium]
MPRGSGSRVERPARLGVAVALAVLAALVSLLALPAAHAGSETGQTLVIGTISRPDSLNPFLATNRSGRAVASILYERLTGYGPDLEPVPGLAASWRRSGNGRVWTFRMAAGRTWSDGHPITAGDAAFSLQRVLRDETSSWHRYVANVVDVRAPTRDRLVVRLARPDARFPAIPVPIVPRSVWRRVPVAEESRFENDSPVSSGPFVVGDRSDPTQLTLVRNPRYTGQEPRVGRIVIRVFDDAGSLADALRDGDVDVADDLDVAAWTGLVGASDVRTIAADGLTFVSLGMNAGADKGDGSPALAKTTVRQALARAIDRDALRRDVLGDQGVTGSTLVPPGSPYHADLPTDPLAFAPQAARDALEAAGYLDGDGDGVRESPEDGEPLRLRLYTRTGVPETEQLGQAIEESLEEVGADVTVEGLTDEELMTRIGKGNFDLFLWGWSGEPDPDFILSTLTCDARPPRGISDTYFCNRSYDRLVARQRAATSRAQRISLVQQAQQLAYRQAPYVVLYYRPDFQAYRTDRVTGLAPQPSPDGPVVFGVGTDSYRAARLLAEGEEPPPEADDEQPGLAAPASPPEGAIAGKLSSNRLWILVAVGILIGALLLSIALVIRSRHAVPAAMPLDESGGSGDLPPLHDDDGPGAPFDVAAVPEELDDTFAPTQEHATGPLAAPPEDFDDAGPGPPRPGQSPPGTTLRRPASWWRTRPPTARPRRSRSATRPRRRTIPAPTSRSAFALGLDAGATAAEADGAPAGDEPAGEPDGPAPPAS